MTIREIVDDEGRRDMRGVFCTDERREGAAAMKGWDGPDCADPDAETVTRKAQAFAGIWKDGSVGVAVTNGMMGFLARNEVDDLWEGMTWEQRGVVYGAFAYGLMLGLDKLPRL